LDQRGLLIISDDVDFSRALTSRWQTERSVPAFTLMGGDLCHGFDADSFEMAIVGAVRAKLLPTVLKTLDEADKPVLLVSHEVQSAQTVRDTHPRIMVLRQHEGWLDAVVLVATEVLRRAEATGRAQRAEQARNRLEIQAMLGRYMLEMRHTLNNALTSVLGNSELLLLEPGSLSAGARSQIDTVRNMALRMHEILQRFSSLEKELSFVEKQAEKEKKSRSQAAAAGA
jgi:signal transduction histidine kinase